MFDNIGGKIKGLAKFTCWVGIICFVILAIISFVEAGNLSPHYYSEERATLITTGFIYLIAGSIGSWLGSLTLYGFGELIEKVTNIEQKLNNGVVAENTFATVAVERHSEYANSSEAWGSAAAETWRTHPEDYKKWNMECKFCGKTYDKCQDSIPDLSISKDCSRCGSRNTVHWTPVKD